MADMTLDQMMEGKTPRKSEPIDLTKGPIQESTPEEALTPAMQAVPVQTGHIDMSGMERINPNDLLPKREETPSQMETDLFNDLDKAINREMDSIERRIDAVLDAQDKEREEAAEKQADKVLEVDLHGSATEPDDDDDNLGLYNDEEELKKDEGTSASIDPKPEFRFAGLSDEEVEAESDHNNHEAKTEKPTEEVDKEKKNKDNTPVIPATKKVNDNIIRIHGTIADDDLFKDDSPDSESDPEEEAKADRKSVV